LQTRPTGEKRYQLLQTTHPTHTHIPPPTHSATNTLTSTRSCVCFAQKSTARPRSSRNTRSSVFGPKNTARREVQETREAVRSADFAQNNKCSEEAGHVLFCDLDRPDSLWSSKAQSWLCEEDFEHQAWRRSWRAVNAQWPRRAAENCVSPTFQKPARQTASVACVRATVEACGCSVCVCLCRD
jgi:hypothetical protein